VRQQRLRCRHPDRARPGISPARFPYHMLL
jgi:hypothetical protein